ncbi:hypothetical protein [Helicobacter sp. MIT 01-3238]|uniref:hypothetical protein n=1 Tax=Helicobacter sp. MIT 01-3238 TaxID=398627 RepID=UPI0015F19668|nr:hypothetical protein [Helicobacter sp. MIT 01-3238]
MTISAWIATKNERSEVSLSNDEFDKLLDCHANAKAFARNDGAADLRDLLGEIQ